MDVLSNDSYSVERALMEVHVKVCWERQRVLAYIHLAASPPEGDRIYFFSGFANE